MSESIHLAVVPETARLQPGSRLALRLLVLNAGSDVAHCHITVHALSADWYDLDTPRVSLPPDSQAPVTLVVHPPDGTAPGSYSLAIVAASEDTPTVPASVVVALAVDVAAGLQMEVRPDAVEGRDAIFRVTFVNRMDSPAIVALTVRDRDYADTLRFYTTPQDGVVVPAGGERPVMVHVAHRGRGIFGRPHRFAIVFHGVQLGRDNLRNPPLTQQANFSYVPLYAMLARALRRLRVWAVPLMLILLLLGMALLRPLPAMRTVTPPKRPTDTPTPHRTAALIVPGARSTPDVARTHRGRAQGGPAVAVPLRPAATVTPRTAPRRKAVTHLLRPTATSTPPATATGTPRPPLTNTPRPAVAGPPHRKVADTPLSTPTSTPRPTVTSTPRSTMTSTPRPTTTTTPLPTPTSTPKPIVADTPPPTMTPLPRPTDTPIPHPTATPTPGHTASVVASGRRRQGAHQVRRQRPVHQQPGYRKAHRPRRTQVGRSRTAVTARHAPVHAVSPPPVRSLERHRHAVKATARHRARIVDQPYTATGERLQVIWPPDAALHSNRAEVLHLTTMPYASIAITLRAVLEESGVNGGHISQVYRYIVYAQADRTGQAAVPLRYAYIPERPVHGTLTVVARTAHDTVQRSIPIVLMRQ